MLRIRQAAEIEHDRRLLEIEEEYRQRLNVELVRATACQVCARRPASGRTRVGRAYVYVIMHEQYAAVKVGISTRAARAGRLRSHMDHSWTVIGVLARLTHRQALSIERAAIMWMRAFSGPALTAEQMPQGGHMETAAGLVLPEKLWAQGRNSRSSTEACLCD
ncbi:hypothetical protein ACWHLZ_34535 [Streptomyces chartreusis]